MGCLVAVGAVAAMLVLPGSAEADGPYCTWYVQCTYDPETEETTCTIQNYFCQNFQGDCDNACDLEHWICETECVEDGGKERAAGVETILETSLRQIREFGEAVVVIDQEPSKLSDSIKANSHTKIVFALGNGDDADDMRRCLNLSAEERAALELLGIGSAMVSVYEHLGLQLN